MLLHTPLSRPLLQMPSHLVLLMTESVCKRIQSFAVFQSRGQVEPRVPPRIPWFLVPPGHLTEKLQMFGDLAQFSTLPTYNMPLPSWIFSKRCFCKTNEEEHKYVEDMRSPEGVKAAQTRTAARNFSFAFQKRTKLMLLLIIILLGWRAEEEKAQTRTPKIEQTQLVFFF